MIEDSVRTNAYQQAIFQNMEEHIRDKVVVDVGCGTGILSMFCAQAGARKVYAIDASKIAIHAKQLIEANGFSNIITGKYMKLSPGVNFVKLFNFSFDFHHVSIQSRSWLKLK